MTTTRTLSAMAIVGLMTASTNAAIVLLGGFDGVNNAAIQSPTISNIDVVGSTFINGATQDMTNGISQINNTNWGNTALDVDAPTIGDGDDLRRAIVQSGTVDANDDFNPWTVTVTITNNGGVDVVLDQVHFILKKDVNNQGPTAGALTYVTGDLTDADGADTGFAIPNGVNGFDIDLSGFLTDTTLGTGESATFRFSHGEPQDPTGNTALRIDNLAISGEVVPEPASLALMGLGGMMVARRRR